MTEPVITDSREIEVENARGSVLWRVTEFDNDRYMLIAALAGAQFLAHFTGQQWVEFQKLIMGLS